MRKISANPRYQVPPNDRPYRAVHRDGVTATKNASEPNAAQTSEDDGAARTNDGTEGAFVGKRTSLRIRHALRLLCKAQSSGRREKADKIRQQTLRSRRYYTILCGVSGNVDKYISDNPVSRVLAHVATACCPLSSIATRFVR